MTVNTVPKLKDARYVSHLKSKLSLNKIQPVTIPKGGVSTQMLGIAVSCILFSKFLIRAFFASLPKNILNAISHNV